MKANLTTKLKAKLKIVRAAQIALLLGLPVLVSAQAGGKGDLTVIVTGFRNTQGEVRVGLFNSGAKFPMTAPMKGIVKPINGKTMTVVFRGVAYGEYAIAVVHDENRNKKMDTNFVGMPKEGAGVSNNPGPRMGPPRWADAKFLINTPQTSKTVKVQYF